MKITGKPQSYDLNGEVTTTLEETTTTTEETTTISLISGLSNFPGLENIGKVSSDATYSDVNKCIFDGDPNSKNAANCYYSRLPEQWNKNMKFLDQIQQLQL